MNNSGIRTKYGRNEEITEGWENLLVFEEKVMLPTKGT
jgi:hypothetical protein